MGNILIYFAFLISVIPIDKDERRHIHIYKQGSKKGKTNCIAKIWIEKNGQKDFELAYKTKGIKDSELTKIINYIDENYTKINSLIDKAFAGEKYNVIKVK